LSAEETSKKSFPEEQEEAAETEEHYKEVAYQRDPLVERWTKRE
jgi:hypothetical protein